MNEWAKFIRSVYRISKSAAINHEYNLILILITARSLNPTLMSLKKFTFNLRCMRKPHCRLFLNENSLPIPQINPKPISHPRMSQKSR